MEAEQLRRVREKADRAWQRGQIVDFAFLVETAAAAGPVSWRDAAELAFRAKHGQATRSMHLLEFVAEIARSLRPESVLDVHVEAPTFLAAACKGGGSARNCGLVRDRRMQEAAQLIVALDWRGGDPFVLLRDLAPERFDLVLAAPPLDMKTRVAQGAPDLAGRTEYADVLVWRAAELVTDQGFLLFHTTDDFLWAEHRRRRWADFARRGLYPQAVVSVAKALGPYASADTSVVLFGRAEAEQLFVGRLEPDTPVAALVRNLVNRRPGRDPYLGIMVPPDTYRGWHSLISEREIARMFAAAELHPLGQVGRIRNVTLKPGVPYDPPANCVFIPTLGFGNVRTLPPDLEGKKQYRLLEVQLNPEIARAEYVAGFLSSPAGKRLRESAGVGSITPHLGVRSAEAIRLPVPPIRVQAETIRSAVHLASMEATVARLHDELWRRPQDAPRVIAQLEAGAKADPVRRWLETLPYPLASVLHRYAALRDPFERYLGLVNFFEAAAQFGCAVLLSILLADAELLASARHAIRSAPGPGRVLFDRADFGMWINLGTTLAKAIRRLDGDREQKPRVEDAAGPATELMRRLANKEVWDVLDQAGKIRNARAHGGVLTKAEVEARTEALEVLLGATEQALASGFEDINLMRADQSRLVGGIHSYPRAQRLRGANSVFEEFEVRTRIPLESGHLALVARDADVSKVLMLAPLIIVGGAKQESRNACYFFNKTLDDGRFKYVSYHFEDEPEIDVHEPELRLLALDLNDASA